MAHVTIVVVRFLAPILVTLALLAACSGGDGAPDDTPTPTLTPRPTATPSPTPLPTPTPSPTPEPTPSPTPYAGAVIDLSGSHSRQGGFLAVRLLYPPQLSTDPAVVIAGVTYPMQFESDRWYTYVGLATWFGVGGYPLDIYSGGEVIASGWLDVTEGGFAFEQLNLPPGSSGDLLTDTARIEAERQEVNAILAGYTPERYWSGPWIIPTTGNVSDPFGTQRSINGGAYFPHSGHDIANEEGTPIYAAASGYVSLAKELYLYGNSVIIDHGVGVFSGYNHMSQGLVSAGQYVNQGDLIGYMGSTGLSTGPHLHWEAVVHGVRVDPTLWTQGGAEP
ncbi:MAG TPA: M23 family metallopeptidase [Dehalococcoidia bacterium]|nr:M23 family metallopeptidase [Dehalococcoidia bacterium]